MVLRLDYWLRTRSRSLPPGRILGELLKTWLFAAAFSILFRYWAIRLFAIGEAAGQDHVVLFASLGAIGCAYGLSSFPSARLPLLLFKLEVTETALLVDFESARRNLRLLRRAGARIVLDDFGAGFASISYLREIDFDAIKLDGALVVSGAESPAALRLLRGVVQLCASLGVPCVAEHIETEEQLALLRRLGCRFGQGFLLCRPVDAAAARELARGRVLPLPVAAGAAKGGRAAA